MLYNSYSFIFVFLPLSLLLYFGAARLISGGVANITLAAVSLLFYGVWDLRDGRWDGRNLLLIVGSILVNFSAGAVIQARRSRGALIAGIVANLAVLGYFKYANFIGYNVYAVLGRPF